MHCFGRNTLNGIFFHNTISSLCSQTYSIIRACQGVASCPKHDPWYIRPKTSRIRDNILEPQPCKNLLPSWWNRSLIMHLFVPLPMLLRSTILVVNMWDWFCSTEYRWNSKIVTWMALLAESTKVTLIYFVNIFPCSWIQVWCMFYLWIILLILSSNMS